MSVRTVIPRWNCSSSDKPCYEFDIDEQDEMCDKWRNFSERMRGSGGKPRKGTKPRCDRVVTYIVLFYHVFDFKKSTNTGYFRVLF